MKKIKVDSYDIELAINGMYQMRNTYPTEKKNQVNDIILSLLDLCDKMKPGRKKRIRIESTSLSMIYQCLIDWRNDKLQRGETTAVEIINEELLLFAK